MNNTQKVETIKPVEAAAMLNINPERIRAGLRAERFTFGTAIPPEKEGGRWYYIIIKSKFLEYVDKINKGFIDDG